MAAMLGEFGIGRATGIDIEGEKTGLLPTREWKQKTFSNPGERVWFPGDTVIIGIGQGYMLVTPLQLAHVASLLAGRGKTFQPHVVTAVRDARSGTLRPIAPKPSSVVDVPEPEYWQRVVNGMVGVTSPPHGTARAALAGAAYKAAGKSGTAQVFSIGQTEKYDEKQVEERLRDHALFIAFAPADEPRIAVAVLVENGRSGSGTAAPVARKVMDAWLVGDTASTAKPATTPADQTTE
jgi:penicillin-binding protein 2